MLAAAQRVAAGHPSLYSDTGLKQFMGKTIGSWTFEDLAIPLRVIATDITHGDRAIFSSGPLAPALLASSAIPGIFPPVRIGEAVYIDGGAVDNASVETALALGARRIFVVDVGYDDSNTGADLWTDETAPVTGARALARGTSAHALAAVAERSVQAISRYHLNRALQRIPRGIETHVIFAASGTKGGSLDFQRAPIWIEHGYQIARDYLRANVPQRVAQVAES
jgi:predicted acylesterase/phospholipase RssA